THQTGRAEGRGPMIREPTERRGPRSTIHAIDIVAGLDGGEPARSPSRTTDIAQRTSTTGTAKRRNEPSVSLGRICRSPGFGRLVLPSRNLQNEPNVNLAKTCGSDGLWRASARRGK